MLHRLLRIASSVMALLLAFTSLTGCGPASALFAAIEETVFPLPHGTRDASFGTGGIATTAIASGLDQVNGVAVQIDGKIVAAGRSWNGSNEDFALVRYTSTGALDASFGGGDGIVTTPIGSSSDVASAVAIQSDGKIVLAGESWSGNADFAVARYTTMGALDTTFGGGDGIVVTPIGPGSDQAYGVAIQDDGRIVVVGCSYNGTDVDFAVARYTAGGALDTSFGGGDGIVTTEVMAAAGDYAWAVAIQGDGKIVVAGSAGGDLAVVRYTADGALDTTFGGGDGIVTTTIRAFSDQAYAIGIQGDGRIVVAGQSERSAAGTVDMVLARYTTAGALDSTFGAGGFVITSIGSGSSYGSAARIQGDGKIVVAGRASNSTKMNYDFAVARYTASGALDASFGDGGITTTQISAGEDAANAMDLQADGNIVVGGVSSGDFAVVRYWR